MSRTRVGIVGAGQLARMTVQAAIALGVELRILATAFHESAARIWPDVMLGSPDDPAAITSLAATCDVTTFDHELANTDAIRELEAIGHLFAPSAEVMTIAQSKLMQRQRFEELGLPVPAFAMAESFDVPARVESFGERHGWPIMVKADRGGYDGRGVWAAQSMAVACEIISALRARGIQTVLEEWVTIEREVAIIIARREGGEVASYPLVETVPEQGMLRELLAPALVDQQLHDQARTIAEQIAAEIGVVGLLAVEFFVSDGRLLVNEIATRPHNSGHYTIEGSVTSQFEQHLRAILDLPLGNTVLTGKQVVTVNVVGTSTGLSLESNLQAALAIDGAHIHIYGKESRAGRKLGHVTVVSDDRQSALTVARRAAMMLECGAGDE